MTLAARVIRSKDVDVEHGIVSRACDAMCAKVTCSGAYIPGRAQAQSPGETDEDAYTAASGGNGLGVGRSG